MSVHEASSALAARGNRKTRVTRLPKLTVLGASNRLSRTENIRKKSILTIPLDFPI